MGMRKVELQKSRWYKFKCWLKYGHDLKYIGAGVEKCKRCGKIIYDRE